MEEEQMTTLKSSGVLLAERFVMFVVNDHKFAVPASAVNQVILAVNIKVIPNSPSSILGIINLHGEAVPIINFRRKFSLPVKKLMLTDNLFILNTSSIKIGFLADEVIGLTKVAEQSTFPSETLIPGQKEELTGMINFHNELIMIYDIERIFLADAEKTHKLHFKKKQ